MSKPVKLEQSVGPNYFIPLKMELTISPTDSKASNDEFVEPDSIILNANNRIVANKYTTDGNFYFTIGSPKSLYNYCQIVSEGELDYEFNLSIDGVNWVEPITSNIFPTTSGNISGGSVSSPKSAIICISENPPGLSYKLAITNSTGDYFINLLI